jgi:hypothetical protein
MRKMLLDRVYLNAQMVRDLAIAESDTYQLG